MSAKKDKAADPAPETAKTTDQAATTPEAADPAPETAAPVLAPVEVVWGIKVIKRLVAQARRAPGLAFSRKDRESADIALAWLEGLEADVQATEIVEQAELVASETEE